MSNADLAAAVITQARNFSGLTTPAFDHMIATRGIGGPLGELGNACHRVANQHDPDAATEVQEARWMDLWNQLQPELQAYGQRCCDRKYTGWSNASRGPIRYAS